MVRSNSRRTTKRAPASLCPHARTRLISMHTRLPGGEHGAPGAVYAVCIDCAAYAPMLPPRMRAGEAYAGPVWILRDIRIKRAEGPLGWREDLLPLACGEDPLALHGLADWPRVCAVGRARAELEHETWLQRIDAYGLALAELDHPGISRKVPPYTDRICGV